MRKLILTFYFIVFHFISFAQLEIPKFKDTTDNKTFPSDTSILKVLGRSQVIILFSRYSAFTLWKEYKIISYQNDNKWHYNILIHPDTSYLFFEIEAPQNSINEIWKTIKRNNLFSISKEKYRDTNCEAMVYDSHHYEFWISVNNEYRKIHYYNPEYFQKNCKGNNERKQVVEVATVFQNFIKKYK